MVLGDALRKVRRARAAVIWLVLGCVPWMVVSLPIANRLGLSVLWCVVPFGALLLWAGWRENRARCPRCDQRFFARQGRMRSAFARRCMNCGLDIHDRSS